MQADKYLSLITSYHRPQPKLQASINAVLSPIVETAITLLSLPSKYEIETAVGDQLRTIALWVGAPLAIPNAVPGNYFGFDGQLNALEMGDTEDASVGGFWRESGMGNGTALPISDSDLREIIKAQIFRNHCDCTLEDAYTVLSIVINIPYVLFDSQQMWVGVGLSEDADVADIELMRAMFPRPAGVGIKFFDGWINGFGWADQPNSLGFGETDDPDTGGYWVEEIA